MCKKTTMWHVQDVLLSSGSNERRPGSSLLYHSHPYAQISPGSAERERDRGRQTGPAQANAKGLNTATSRYSTYLAGFVQKTSQSPNLGDSTSVDRITDLSWLWLASSLASSVQRRGCPLKNWTDHSFERGRKNVYVFCFSQPLIFNFFPFSIKLTILFQIISSSCLKWGLRHACLIPVAKTGTETQLGFLSNSRC